MNKIEANHIFSEIIWSAELSNMTLAEYLDTYAEEHQQWIDTEAACKEAGIPLFLVQCKDVMKEEIEDLKKQAEFLRSVGQIKAAEACEEVLREYKA